NRRLGPARRRHSRQLALLPARRAALVHGKYRHSPCAPLVQRNAVLPAAPGPARSPGTRCRRPAHAVGEPLLRPPRALGRELATAHLVPRPAPSGRLIPTSQGPLRNPSATRRLHLTSRRGDSLWPATTRRLRLIPLRKAMPL